MAVPGSANFLLAGAQGYQISRSLRFNSADSAYLNRTPASAGSQTTWTWSGWIKRSAIGASAYRIFGTGDNNSATNQTSINISSDSLDFYNVNGGNKTSSALLRDPSAWYHVVAVWDSNNATASDRMRLYLNGSRITAFSSSTDPSSGTTSIVNSVTSHAIGTLPTNPGNYFSGYLTEINFIDGQALTPSSFGETDTTTGVWKSKKYAGTYGTNGFYLNFADNSGTTSTTLGKDSSGNGNNWTPNNFSVTAGAGNDSLVDSPTRYGNDTGAGNEVRGNYATWNPIHVISGNTSRSFVNGNLDYSVTASEGSGEASAVTTMPLPTTGKWYWEITPTTVATAAASRTQIGIMGKAQINYAMGANADCFGYTAAGGSNSKVTAGTFSSYGSSYTANDVIGVAVDLDNGAIYFAKNGTWQNSGVPTSGSAKTGAAFTTLVGANEYFPAAGYWGTFVANWGARPFAYTAPSGFKALCTTNLPEPTILKPSTVMDVALDTGANILTTAQNLLTAGADLIWIKDRANANNHQLIDTVRGGTATLQSNTTSAETTYSAPSGNSAAWCWDAGSSTATNTSGIITSQVRANASAGFSVVTYTGTGANATVGHGLGVAPSMIIYKRRSATDGWVVYHASSGTANSLTLNSTSAQAASGSIYWNSTAPTSTLFTAGTDTAVNASGGTYVAYCFSAVAGYSAFGSYTGNGSTDGPFVFTGFRPRWILVKVTSTTGSWYIYDVARSTYNAANHSLFPNLSSAEDTTTDYLVDVLSNGFKWRSVNGNVNGSSSTYVWAAFAENPLKYSLAR